jgi:hypothetical protein
MKKVFSILLMLFMSGFWFGTNHSMPKNQLLFLNKKTQRYYAPPCLMENGFDSREAMQTFANANNLTLITNQELASPSMKASPDNECREAVAFMEEGRSLTGCFFEWIKVLPKKKSKWNKDGTWNSI